MTADALVPRLAQIVDEFTDVPEKDRLLLLLEFAAELPPLPDRFAAQGDALERVDECQTPLFLATEVDAQGAVRLYFDAPPESPTTRGFAGILHAGLDGLPADEVLAVPEDFPARLGLRDAVSPLRLRGMSAMLTRIKRQVRQGRAAARG